jgi:hypothetical protein
LFVPTSLSPRYHCYAVAGLDWMGCDRVEEN